MSVVWSYKMPETQDQFRTRIQASGKWDEFVAYRQALEKHDREPRDAWIEAARAFGFEGHYSLAARKKAKAQDNPVTLVQSAPAEAFDGKRGNVRGDFEWVYSNIGVVDITPESAPSSGAWGLLEFARSDPKEFYKSWMSMVSRSGDTDAQLEGFKSDAAKSVNEIAEMLGALESTIIREGPQGHGGEPEVPPGGPEARGDGSEDAGDAVGRMLPGHPVLDQHIRVDIRPEEAEPEAPVHNV